MAVGVCGGRAGSAHAPHYNVALLFARISEPYSGIELSAISSADCYRAASIPPYVARGFPPPQFTWSEDNARSRGHGGFGRSLASAVLGSRVWRWRPTGIERRSH